MLVVLGNCEPQVKGHVAANVNVGNDRTKLIDVLKSVDVNPAPLRIILGSQLQDGTLATLRKRIDGFEAQRELAASTDFPPGE